MAEFFTTVHVTDCTGCPFYMVAGMEHMLYCNHPALDHRSYGGAIITRHDIDVQKAPEACPLRSDGATVITKTIVFTGS